MRSEIAFAGQTEPARCKCHEGLWVALVFLLHPTNGQMLIATEHFETEELANQSLEPTIMKHAKGVIEAVGLSVDDAAKIDIRHGDAGQEMIDKWNRNSNQNLH